MATPFTELNISPRAELHLIDKRIRVLSDGELNLRKGGWLKLADAQLGAMNDLIYERKRILRHLSQKHLSSKK